MKRERELTNPLRINITNPDDVNSFRFNSWETVLLEKGERIYRLFTPDQTYETGFFWFDKSTFDAITRNGTNLDNLINNARSGLAVKEEWSRELNRLTIGDIEADFHAAYGPTNFQSMTGHNNVFHIGGLYQLYILQKDWNLISQFSSIAI